MTSSIILLQKSVTKLAPCIHRWKKVGICKECKVQKIKWVCEKCNKIYRGVGSPPISKKNIDQTTF